MTRAAITALPFSTHTGTDAGKTMLTLYTFGDSILDSGWYNDLGLNPGQLLVRNDDERFPEFQSRDLSSRGAATLIHRATDGGTVTDLPAQARGLAPTGESVAILTIGGNDLLQGLLIDPGPGLDAFAAALERFVRDLPIRPVHIGNVYDPTFGNDALDFTGLPPALARERHRQVNDILAAVANRYGTLVDLHAHFLMGDPTWFTSTIEPSLRGASEIRRCFLPHLGIP
jgi:lysophospholipase L1-like esterase